MITKNINACLFCRSLIIGRQMENNYRQFIFDCSGFDVEVTSIMLVHQRSKDVAPYIAATSTTNTLTWTVSDTDTAYAGYGNAELRITFADGLAKSIVYQTNVIASITGDSVIPEPLQSWYDALIEYIDEHAASPEQIAEAVADYLETHPIDAPVQSVNGKTGTVVLTAADVGALADSVTIPTRVSQLTNDAGYITSAPVQSVNNKTGVVVLSASDVEALPDTTTAADIGGYVKPSAGIPKTDLSATVQASLDKAETALQTAPVTSVDGKTGAVQILPNGGSAGQVLTKTASGTAWQTVQGGGAVDSVNGQTGTVVLTASDVHALPDSTVIPTVPTNVSAFQNDAGYLTAVPSEYVTDTELNTALAPKANTADLATVATSGDYADLSNKPTIPTVPSNVSAFTNDAGYITASQAPVQSVNGQTGAVVIPSSGMTQAQINALDGMFRVAAYAEDAAAEYAAFCAAFGITQAYTITNTLTNVTNSNTATSITSGSSYSGTLTADTGYNIDTVTVTMGGTDITSTAYSGGSISIANVTGDIVITASASASAGPDIDTWTNGVAYNLVWVDGYYVNASDGQFLAYTGWSRSGYIDCAGAGTLEFPNLPSGGFGQSNCFYDANKARISNFRPNEGIPIAVPSNAVYFAISAENAKRDAIVCIPYE